MKPCLLIVWTILMVGQAFAQTLGQASETEKSELAAAIQDAQTSPQDTIRVLEEHLRRYPQTVLIPQIAKLMAEAAIEVKDTRRTALYGTTALTSFRNDSHLLDHVAEALLEIGGRENAQKALDYAAQYEDYLIKVPVARGRNPARNQEDQDRSIGRALLFQARANAELGNDNEARLKATLSYLAYADERSAKELAHALERLGRQQEAIEKMADAFTISDSRVTDEMRAADRKELGAMFAKLHGGSEVGLGELILAAYDRTSADVQKRRAELRKLDPNDGITEAGKFTLVSLDDGKLNLASQRGKVLILDFWATWCVPCRTQHPLYDEVKKKFRDRDDVMFLSINSDDERDVVEPFLQQQKWSREVYYDSGLVGLLNVLTIPATIIIDQDGNIASRMNGFVPDTFVEMLTARIRAVLAGPVQPTPPDSSDVH